MSGITVKRAKKDDLEQIATLFNAYRVFYKQTSNIEQARKFIYDRLSTDESIIFLAIDTAKKAIGFVQLYYSFSSVSLQKTLILNDLYVENFARKQGVGALLLKHCQSYAKTQRYKGLALETDIDNQAQYLYEKLGWHKEDQTLHYFWKVV